jgi:hypothetical protein
MKREVDVFLLLTRVLTLAALLILISSGVQAQNQSAAIPHSPDLLGIYPGMPANAARLQLQKHSTDFQLQTTRSPEEGFSLTILDPQNFDNVEVFLTLEPNPSAVWMVRRTQNISNTNPMSKSALLAGLHNKYGKETLSQDRGGGGTNLYWIFDQSGHLLPSADAGLMGCSGNNFISNIRNGPGNVPLGLQPCYASFFAVAATINNRDAELVAGYSVELVNLPYAFQAASATANAKNAQADEARRKAVTGADQNKPTF